MDRFPRTIIGGVSLPRLIIGTNWFRGYSHTTQAKSSFIKEYQNPDTIADILEVYLKAGIDAVLGGDMEEPMDSAIVEAEQRTGRKMIRIITPKFNTGSGGPADRDLEYTVDHAKKRGATFCFPHQATTDALVDKTSRRIRNIEKITHLVREYEMIPGLSTHLPEAVIYADEQKADVETYIQIYNSAGFLMTHEIDWIMSIIHAAKKPVITIKPLAAGRLVPLAGLSFVWNTIREQDMVCVGTLTPDEAREVIEMSLDFIHNRLPKPALQWSGSKASVTR